MHSTLSQTASAGTLMLALAAGCAVSVDQGPIKPKPGAGGSGNAAGTGSAGDSGAAGAGAAGGGAS